MSLKDENLNIKQKYYSINRITSIINNIMKILFLNIISFVLMSMTNNIKFSADKTKSNQTIY